MSRINSLVFPYPPQFEAEAVAMALPASIERAATFAEELAGSYRGFHVGADIGIGEVRYGGLVAITAGNYKSNPIEGGPKVCAEEAGMSKIRDIGQLLLRKGIRPLYVTVTAPTQPDIDSKLSFPTTHPCGKCRDRPEVLADPTVDDLTPVITVDTQNGVAQVFSIKELRDVHRSDYSGPAELGSTTFAASDAGLVYPKLLEANFEGLLEGLSQAEQIRLAWTA